MFICFVAWGWAFLLFVAEWDGRWGMLKGNGRMKDKDKEYVAPSSDSYC